MNRRTFLTGLASTTAAVAFTGPVARIAPYREGPAFLYPTLNVQPEWLHDWRQITKHVMIYASDDVPIEYSGVRLFVDAPSDENTVWGIPE